MKILKHFLFLILLWIVLFFGIEFVCGFFTGNNYFKADCVNQDSARISYGYFEPNQNRRILFPGHSPYNLKINELGLRDTGNKKENESYSNRILCIGDSFTFGLFLDNEDSYPFLLQQAVESDNTLVLNAGIGNTGIMDHWYYLKEKGIELNPDVVIVNFFGNDLNDLLRDEPYYEEVKNMPPEKWWVKSNFFRSILGMYVQSKYNRWLSKVDDQKTKKILKDKLGGLDNALYVSWNYHTWQSIKDPYSDDLAAQWQKHLAYLQQMNLYLKDRGKRMIYIINPELVSIFELPKNRHEDILINFLEVNQIPYINLIEVFKQHKEDILSFYNDPPRDFHLNAKGNAIVVQEILKILK